MNGNFDNNQQQGQNGNGGRPSFNNPNIPPYGTPNDPTAGSAQTLGIVGLVLSILSCFPVGLVLGIIACNKAKTSRTTLGYSLPEARTGRICGIVSIAISATYLALLLIPFIVLIIVAIADSTAGSNAAFLL